MTYRFKESPGGALLIAFSLFAAFAILAVVLRVLHAAFGGG